MFKLLSTANPKIQKGTKLGYLSFILHLAPADLSGRETCPKRTVGCTAACLNTAGRGGMFKRGENTIIITHTAPDTTQTAYTIYVRRAGQWTGFDIRTPGVTMTPAFTSSIHEYTLTDVPYSVSSLTHILTHSYEEPGHLSCNRCDWWQYSSRGEQTMGLNPGANRIEWIYSSV